MNEVQHPTLFGDEDPDSSGSSGKNSSDRKTEEGEDPSSENLSDRNATDGSGFSDRNTSEGAPGNPSDDNPSGRDFAKEERSDEGSFSDKNTSGEYASEAGDETPSENDKSSVEEESSAEDRSSLGSPAGGRPPKPPEERRDARLSVCMTEDLLARIEQQAEDAGLSKSAYARRALAGKDLQTRVDQQTLDTLYNAGVSMRKVQEAIEAGRRPKAADVEKALQALETVIEEIDQRGE